MIEAHPISTMSHIQVSGKKVRIVSIGGGGGGGGVERVSAFKFNRSIFLLKGLTLFLLLNVVGTCPYRTPEKTPHNI